MHHTGYTCSRDAVDCPLVHWNKTLCTVPQRCHYLHCERVWHALRTLGLTIDVRLDIIHHLQYYAFCKTISCNYINVVKTIDTRERCSCRGRPFLSLDFCH